MLKSENLRINGLKEEFIILEVQSCSLNEGNSNADFKANDKIWNGYLDDGGFKAGVWRWWPETGSSIDTDYDYLLAAYFPTVEDYGAARDGRLQAMLSGTRPAEFFLSILFMIAICLDF